MKPLFKSGARNLKVSYCPISILSKLYLVFERTFFAPLYAFASSKIYSLQFGFVRKRSTVLRLLIFLENLYKHYDKIFLFCSYLDLSKAFHRISHHVLSKRLHKIGFFWESTTFHFCLFRRQTTMSKL